MEWCLQMRNLTNQLNTGVRCGLKELAMRAGVNSTSEQDKTPLSRKPPSGMRNSRRRLLLLNRGNIINT